MSVSSLKEEGNEKFKGGNYVEALTLYTKALDLEDIKDTDKAVLYKNRAMCNLKLEDYETAVSDATQALDYAPNDPKALYRRCLAYEKLDRLEESYKDAGMLLKVEPKNVAVKPILARLTPIIRDRTDGGEVSGRKRANDPNTSGNYIYCKHCEAGNESLQAVGFCQNCSEYLCRTCIKYHPRIVKTKDHVILDANNFPQGFATPVSTSPGSRNQPKAECKVQCEVHPGKTITHFCITHDMSGCGDCMDLEHSMCKKEHVNDASTGFNKGKTFKKFKRHLYDIEKTIGCYEPLIKGGFSMIESINNKAITSIREVRAEINQYLDLKETTLLDDVEKHREAGEVLFKNLEEESKSGKGVLDDIRHDLDTFKGESNNMFVVTKQAQNKLSELETIVSNVRKSMKLDEYVFEKDENAYKLLTSEISLGKIHSHEVMMAMPMSHAKLVREPDIYARSPRDKQHSLFRNIALLAPGILIVADFVNKCLKVIESSKSKITSRLQLSAKPWGICPLPGNKVAVTLCFEEKILILSTLDGLSKEKYLKTKGECAGIDSHRDNLVIAFSWLPRVEVMTLDGEVLHTIAYNNNGEQIFACPDYVKVSEEEGKPMIHVSDVETALVTKVSLDGQILYSYKDQELSSPMGMALTGEGELMVCGWDSHNIQLISKTGEKIRTLVDKRDGVQYVYALWYSMEEKKLFVGLNDPIRLEDNDLPNHVAVFKVID